MDNCTHKVWDMAGSRHCSKRAVKGGRCTIHQHDYVSRADRNVERMAEANRLVMGIGDSLKAQLGLPDARVEICHTALAGQRSRNYALVVSFDELEKLSARLEKLAARLDRLTNKGDL